MTKLSLALALMLCFTLPSVTQPRQVTRKKNKPVTQHFLVTDPQDAVIPNAAIWLSGKPGIAMRVATTDENGTCVFRDLSEETYTLNSAFPGFKMKQIKDLRVVDGSVITIVLEFQL